MPYARIEIPRGWTLCPRRRLLDAVDESFVSVLGLPSRDSFLRLCEYDPDEGACVPARHGPHFLFLEIQMFAGRSLEIKRHLYRDLLSRLVALGLPAGDVTIALVEIPLDNWGLQGGCPASELVEPTRTIATDRRAPE